MKNETKLVQILTTGVLLMASIARAQESRAVITGTVSDAQGAVITAATVAVTNVGTNVVTSVKTNDRGLYAVPPINPGMYSIDVSAAGFKKLVQNGVELRTGDRKGLDFSLEVGGITETVTITAEAVLLDSQSSSLGTVMNQKLVEDLPTRGRNVFDLVQKTAGVSARGQNTYGLRPFDNGENGVRINGGLANTNEVLLDGAPNTQRETTNAANVSIVPPPEAVGEVKITTNPYDAEFGRTGGGVITMSLRSGTNDLHGSVAWTVRNNIFNANAFESNSNPGPDGKPRAKLGLQHNEPVAQIQGPVYIPHLYDGRNKSFFMYSTDIYRDRRPSPSSITVPTALEARGDFSQTYVSGLGGASVAIYDPLATPRVQFPGNVIPSSRINPIAAKTVAFYPKPNLGLVARGQPNLLVAPNNDYEP